jgi:hypothetical protein
MSHKQALFRGQGTFTERDPAERSAFNRLFYRDRRPTWLGQRVSLPRAGSGRGTRPCRRCPRGMRVARARSTVDEAPAARHE